MDSPQNQLFNYSPRPIGSTEASTEVIAPDGAPNTALMRHLLDVFIVHFGCQYPFLDRATLDGKIESRIVSVFLLNSIAAIAARWVWRRKWLSDGRFSTHPAVALPDLKPYDYGNVFYSRAKAMLGSMLAVPSRETVAAFVLLASCGFANGKSASAVCAAPADSRLRIRSVDDDWTGGAHEHRLGSSSRKSRTRSADRQNGANSRIHQRAQTSHRKTDD